MLDPERRWKGAGQCIRKMAPQKPCCGFGAGSGEQAVPWAGVLGELWGGWPAFFAVLALGPAIGYVLCGPLARWMLRRLGKK